MDPIVVGVFLVVAVGMIIGGIPRLQIDRAVIAAVGALILVLSGRIGPAAAWNAIDWPTVAIVAGVMAGSGILLDLGVHDVIARRVTSWTSGANALLFAVVCTAGALSTCLGSRSVAIALTRTTVDVCGRRNLEPTPFLIAAACAATVGTAATLIGSAHAVLIWQTLDLSFARYLVDGGVLAIPGLGAVYIVTWVAHRHRWNGDHAVSDAAAAVEQRGSPRQHSSLIDWHLLLLLAGLLVINAAFARSGLLSGLLMMARNLGIGLTNLPALAGATAVLSHLATSLPAVSLLLAAARDDAAGTAMVLASTFASVAALTGSVAATAVIDEASRRGVGIRRRAYGRIAVPVTLATLSLAYAWLRIRHG